MTFVHADAASIGAFLGVVVLVLAAFFVATYVANRRLGYSAFRTTVVTAAVTLIWIGLTSVPVATGMIERSLLPAVPIFFLAVNGAGLIVGLSPLGTRLALGISIPWLVAFQAFRLPLELVLHSWASQGTIPESMTWNGQNLDVITGVAALVAAPLAARSWSVAWAFNLLGIALLANVGRVAILSSPFPFAWDVEPPLQLVLHLPYAWIGTVCVAGALAGHVILTRALLLRCSR